MKTMNKTTLKLLVAIFSVSLLIAGCQSNQKKSGKMSKSDKMEKAEVEEKVREVVYPLPSSYEVTEMLNEVGASYIIGLSNSVENVDNYFSDKEQALNLGVYSADLSYASTYNMKQYTMNYIEAIEQLVKELGVTGAFTRDFIDKVEANIDNKDELVDLITNAFYDTYSYLVRRNKEDLSVLVLTGTWVESLYITTHISENTYRDTEMVKIMLQQRESLIKLLEIMKKHENHETIQELYHDLKPILEIYRTMDESSIKESEVNAIVENIEEVRNKIIS